MKIMITKQIIGLWSAVMFQAIEDLGRSFRYTKAKPKGQGLYHAWQRMVNIKRIRKEAYWWIFEAKNTDIGSFMWILDLVSMWVGYPIDPEVVRDELREVYDRAL